MFTVSSSFSSHNLTICHGCPFHSFPLTVHRNSLPSCFPLSLFHQLLWVKNAIFGAMSTWSKGSKNRSTFKVEGIERLTWCYLKLFLPVPMFSHVVLKDPYIGADDLNIEKWSSVLQTCFLLLPDQLPIAQSLFGRAAGLGFHCFLLCRLQSRSMNARVITSCQVE
jgi:hypothetical protein